MPNWPIPHGMRSYLATRVYALTNRPVLLSRLGVPLDDHQIQHGGLNLTEDQLITLQKLWHDGVRTIDRSCEIRLAFLQENFPYLRRGVVLRLTTNTPLFTGRATAYGMGTTQYKADESHYLVPHFNNLDPDQRTALLAWLDRAVRQVRMKEIADQCVNNIINDEKRTPTIAHLTAIWPAMAGVFDPAGERHVHMRRTIEDWRERFRNPPLRNKQLYTPPAGFMERWVKLIKIADVLLAQGMLLDDVKDTGPIKSKIECWQRIEGDIVF